MTRRNQLHRHSSLSGGKRYLIDADYQIWPIVEGYTLAADIEHAQTMKRSILYSVWVEPNRGMSRCDQCGERYPSAPPGYIHKCGMCHGYCKPIGGAK